MLRSLQYLTLSTNEYIILTKEERTIGNKLIIRSSFVSIKKLRSFLLIKIKHSDLNYQ